CDTALSRSVRVPEEWLTPFMIPAVLALTRSWGWQRDCFLTATRLRTYITPSNGPFACAPSIRYGAACSETRCCGTSAGNAPHRLTCIAIRLFARVAWRWCHPC